MADYVKQIRELRQNLDSKKMSSSEVYEALESLEETFQRALKTKTIQLGEAGDFYSEYLSLQEDCEDSMDRGFLEEVLLGE